MGDPTSTTNGNAELIEFLQGHFTKVDEHFTKVDAQLVGVKLDLSEVKEGLKHANERIDGLYALIDSFITLHQKLDIELTALRDKYNRLAKAHNELVARVARIEGASV